MSGIIGVSPNMKSGITGRNRAGTITVTKKSCDFATNQSVNVTSLRTLGTGFSFTTRHDTVFIYASLTFHTNAYAAGGSYTGAHFGWYFDDSSDTNVAPSGSALMAADMYSGWYTTAGGARRDKHDRQTIIGGAAVSPNTHYYVQGCTKRSSNANYVEFTYGDGYLMEVS